MRSRLSSRLALAVIVATLWTARPAAAQQTALTYSSDGISEAPAAGFTHGWSFSLSTAVRVTALGFWDFNGDGLLASHFVGIWNDATGDLLVGTTVPRGTTAALTVPSGPAGSGFRFVSVGSSLLPPGSYVIGAATTGNDPITSPVPAANVTLAPGITYRESRYIATNSARPTNSDGVSADDAYFGPNFQFNAVPEPSTWALFGTGLLGLGAMARRRRM